MKFIAFICSIILFGFTCLVLLTDGVSTKTAYLVFTILLLLVPAVSVAAFFRNREIRDWFGFHWKRGRRGEEGRGGSASFAAVLLPVIVLAGNLALLAFSVWAFISQYPHPREEGFVAYMVFVFLTPVLTSVVMVRDLSQMKE